MLRLLCANGSTPLTVNTACSGTDAAITALRNLGTVFEGFDIDHCSSTEYNEAKQEYIRCVFPDLAYLFSRLEHIGQARALNMRRLDALEVVEATRAYDCTC